MYDNLKYICSCMVCMCVVCVCLCAYVCVCDVCMRMSVFYCIKFTNITNQTNIVLQ